MDVVEAVDAERWCTIIDALVGWRYSMHPAVDFVAGGEGDVEGQYRRTCVGGSAL